MRIRRSRSRHRVRRRRRRPRLSTRRAGSRAWRAIRPSLGGHRANEHLAPDIWAPEVLGPAVNATARPGGDGPVLAMGGREVECRSEERRVGKEWRSRWGAEQCKKKGE